MFQIFTKEYIYKRLGNPRKKLAALVASTSAIAAIDQVLRDFKEQGNNTRGDDYEKTMRSFWPDGQPSSEKDAIELRDGIIARKEAPLEGLGAILHEMAGVALPRFPPLPDNQGENPPAGPANGNNPPAGEDL